ncbi:GNAT family N-acetyltransferase [Sediminibacillus dalangtanensis]|uniref:GNAT family N-acetyltransferase n=1 Tax=Sediminibacillus dalangtanensis TaxID=2729421 RepID=A0ABX7VTI5_9BACI|nr:GNAT family N-acetyltransferase [Sediminibacillus dalangtanensis]QTM99976.1 GNAT family N-acetyltransferase [Sediminibacillus dalangtanensis]
MIRIRKAATSDAEAIAKVSVDSWISTYRGIVPEKILKKITYQQRTVAFKKRLDDPQHYMFVAETTDGQIVGFVNGGPERSGDYPYEGEIYSLYILDEYHHLQIGRKLVRVMTEQLLTDGYDSLLVWVLEENPAKGFYEHLGAEPVDRKYLAELEAFETALGWTAVDRLL